MKRTIWRPYWGVLCAGLLLVAPNIGCILGFDALFFLAGFGTGLAAPAPSTPPADSGTDDQTTDGGGGTDTDTDGGTDGDGGNGDTDAGDGDTDGGDDGDTATEVVANAGVDQNVDAGDVVQLDGTASTGDSLSFSWAQTVGTSVALTGDSTSSPTFTAPNVNETLTFELTASDGMAGADTDTVDIFVTAQLVTLFVVNNGSPMTSYANAGALSGEIVPNTRLNLGAATSLFQPRSIVVTRDGRLLISRNNGGIVGYDAALTADEANPADVVVDGNNTDLESPVSFAYDATNDRLYVGNTPAEAGILVFENVSSAGFNGDVAPARAFGPPDRQPFTVDAISIEMSVVAMDLDSAGNLFVVDTSGLNTNQSRILVFADPGSAEGLTEPAQEFTSSSWTNIEDIVVDADDVLYVVAGEESVNMFTGATMLAGDVTPSSILTVQLSLVDLQGIVLSSDGTGYLADRNNHAIYSYDNLADRSGTLGPDRTLEGFDTRLASPRQMFLLEQ